MDDYSGRVNQTTIREEYEKLNKEASANYLKEYSKRLRINDLHLEPYDATNEVFKITSSFGPVYVRVPLKNGEAESFKKNWKSIRFQNPRILYRQRQRAYRRDNIYDSYRQKVRIQEL